MYLPRRTAIHSVLRSIAPIFLIASHIDALPQSTDATGLYQQLQNAAVFDKSARLENVVLKRDRVTITFTAGMIYLSPPIAGKARAGVFVGTGKLQAAPPAIPFEQDNLRRLIKGDELDADFRTAVLRFSDDSASELLKAGFAQGTAQSEQASSLAIQFGSRFVKETGVNISARLLESILNQETPGVFLIQVEGGKRGTFTYLFDPQTRIPTRHFGVNAGEKGLIFQYDDTIYSNDIWMAFHSEGDYSSGTAVYSDALDNVDTDKYTMALDLMEPKKILGLTAKLDLVARTDSLQVIYFSVGEGLRIADEERRKKQMHILKATLADSVPTSAFQEPWETGFTVILPKALSRGEHFSLILDLKGDFMMESPIVSETYFPRSTVSWYPRHGYLARSRFDISMTHRKKDHVVTVGQFLSEGPDPNLKDAVRTEFQMDQPIGFATFAVGPYEIHKDVAKQEGGKDLPLEFYSMPGYRTPIKEDFILAEMNNSIRFFSKMFGDYPYGVFRGAFHPFPFGQGFATTIMIPGTDRADYHTFSFIAHETSHQWWGDMVLWRSYRDQWLSEGFAEYSGMLYVQVRERKSERELIERDREVLRYPPGTLTGVGSGRLVDVGPLVIGHRVESRETGGAYTTLTYKKGALVLRMLHFLFTDPQTGNGQPFFDAMQDFVKRYKDGTASSAQFFDVVNDHVKDTAIAKKYGYKDLNWFYRQWVTQTYLPSYELSYHIENDPSGAVVLKGDLLQKGVPDAAKWFMPLPIAFHFPGGGEAHGTVAVLGEHTAINVKLPRMPEKVELDPDLWILSEKTSTHKQ